jgi:hypothetical protein
MRLPRARSELMREHSQAVRLGLIRILRELRNLICSQPRRDDGNYLAGAEQ